MTQLPQDITRLDTALLTFPEGEVLATYSDILKRAKLIHKATYFGNIKHEKVTIVFAGEASEVYHIYTTIWLHYNGHIFLKGDITIPVERILDIRFD